MKYHKLVRDKIPEYIRERGGNPLTHIASEAEYWEKLKEKVYEEFEEFKKAESQEEFADVLEVFEAIREYKQFDRLTIAAIQKKKAEERGKFKDRIILDES